jgi:N-acetylglucosaminyl-diphospho-decaprenol L-rhamnosyltransferase
MRIGIVIVTYNSERHIDACLDACHRTTDAEFSIVVVDNASADSTLSRVRKHPGVQLLANDLNLGFAGAVNQGIRALDTEVVLLLNPDTRLIGGVELLAKACAEPGVAAAGGRLEDSMGRPQRGFMVRRLPTAASLSFEILGFNRLWPGNPVNRRYRCLDLNPDNPAQVEQPAGAFVALRREVWEQAGEFDDSYHPLWFEDVDFFRRLKDRGYQVRFIPGARAVHTGGHSLDSTTWAQRQLYWYGSLLRYAARHFRPSGRIMVCGSLMISWVPRTIAGMIQNRSVRPLIVQSRLFRIAGACLLFGEAGIPANDLRKYPPTARVDEYDRPGSAS